MKLKNPVTLLLLFFSLSSLCGMAMEDAEEISKKVISIHLHYNGEATSDNTSIKNIAPCYYQVQYKSASPVFEGYQQYNSPFFDDYPMVPLFHPSDPKGMVTPLTIQMPPEGFPGLPQTIQLAFEKTGIDIHKSLAIFVSVQNIPSHWKEASIYFNPQHATHGSSSQREGKDWSIKKATFGLFYSDSQKIHFFGHEPNDFMMNRCFGIHPEGSLSPEDQKEGKFIFSGKDLHVEGIEPGVSQSVWSLVCVKCTKRYEGEKQEEEGQEKEEGEEKDEIETAFVTLHWLLNENHLKELSQILISNETACVTTLMDLIRNNKLLNSLNILYKTEPLLSALGTKVNLITNDIQLAFRAAQN